MIEGDEHPESYTRVIGNYWDGKYYPVEIEFDGDLKAFKKALYQDWNLASDKYGLIDAES